MTIHSNDPLREELERRSAALVNHFDGIGCKLISPMAPQPGRLKTLEFSDKRVEYDVDFVAP